MKISVVIPVYNRPEKLARLLESIEKQTLLPYEVIVIDDGSTEDIRIIVDKYQSIKVNYIKIKNSGGPAKPRNIGIDVATGDWIAFCDSDDWWEPNKLDVSLKHGRNVDFIFHKLKINYEKENVKRGVIGNDFRGEAFEHLLEIRNPIPLSSVLVKREIVEKIKFDESKDLAAIEDYDLWLRIFKMKINYIFINDVLGYYSIDQDNISQVSERSVFRLDALKKKVMLMGIPEKNKRTFLQNYWYSVGVIYLRLEKKIQAREAFFNAINLRISICGLKSIYRLSNTW